MTALNRPEIVERLKSDIAADWGVDNQGGWESVPHCQFENLNTVPGVYAVFSICNELLYVGQTSNLRSRLLTHRSAFRWAGKFRIGRVHAVVVMDPTERKQLERDILAEIRPPFNNNFPVRRPVSVQASN